MNEKTVGMLIGKKNVYEYPAFWTEKNMDIVEKFLKVHMD